MAATPRTKRNKQTSQADPKQGASSVQRQAEALSDITLTEQEAEFVDRMLAAPSKLPPEFAPRPVPRADRSLLYRTTR